MIKSEEIPKEYTSYYINNFSDANEYCILHHPSKNERYTTGLATNKEHNLIYYFYANY